MNILLATRRKAVATYGCDCRVVGALVLRWWSNDSSTTNEVAPAMTSLHRRRSQWRGGHRVMT